MEYYYFYKQGHPRLTLQLEYEKNTTFLFFENFRHIFSWLYVRSFKRYDFIQWLIQWPILQVRITLGNLYDVGIPIILLKEIDQIVAWLWL